MDKQFRILHDNRDLIKFPDMPVSLPWNMLNEEWAQKNHSQTLDRLNQRGGLGVSECLCNIKKTRLTFKDETREEIDELKMLIKNFKGG